MKIYLYVCTNTFLKDYIFPCCRSEVKALFCMINKLYLRDILTLTHNFPFNFFFGFNIYYRSMKEMFTMTRFLQTSLVPVFVIMLSSVTLHV